MDTEKDLVAMTLDKEEKDKRIKKEFNRLRSLYKKMPKDTMKVVEALLRNAAFMAVTLHDLQEHINLHGTTDQYKNGEHQWGYKKSPQVEIHIAMTKNHNATMKQLADLLPKHTPKPGDDGFDAFVSERDD
jgi:predicted transcriptional regulator